MCWLGQVEDGVNCSEMYFDGVGGRGVEGDDGRRQVLRVVEIVPPIRGRLYQFFIYLK